MLALSSVCIFFCAVFLACASADPGTGGSVVVETELARKSEGTVSLKSEHHAPDHIWSGVILATNPDVPKAIPKELQKYEGSLKRVFGYNQFEIVGTATELIDEQVEHWLVPVHDFSLEVRARHAASKEARGGYLLNIQLYQEKRPLVSTEVKLAPGSPMFIRGPECGKGEIILILQIQR